MTERIEKLRDSLHGEFTRTGPMTERERVEQWFRDNAKYDHTDPESVAIVDDMIVIVANFSAKRVREELEALAKQTCKRCADGVPLCEGAPGCPGVHDEPHHYNRGSLLCYAMHIRKRISELAGSEEGSR